jgi:hypothetical protein
LDGLLRLGDPWQLVGVPTDLRRAAGDRRRLAARLRATAMSLDHRLRTLVAPGRWDGTDSQACWAAWQRLRSEFDDGAAAYDRVASTLEAAAADADRLNARVGHAVHELSQGVEEARRHLLDPALLDAALLAALLQQLLLMTQALENAIEEANRFLLEQARQFPEEVHFRLRVGEVPRVGFRTVVLPGGRLGLRPIWEGDLGRLQPGALGWSKANAGALQGRPLVRWDPRPHQGHVGPGAGADRQGILRVVAAAAAGERAERDEHRRSPTAWAARGTAPEAGRGDRLGGLASEAGGKGRPRRPRHPVQGRSTRRRLCRGGVASG